MAIANIDINDFSGIGRRIMELAREKEIGSPELLANCLYKTQRELIEPAERKNKHGRVVKDEKHDIEAIRRMVQKHLNESDPVKIQSKYMLAYSRIFNCSLDYLFGSTTIRSADVEVVDICNKTQLSEKALENIIEGREEFSEGISYTKWWSNILEREEFFQIPSEWFRYCNEVLEYEDLHKKVDAIRAASEKADDNIYKNMMMIRADSLDKMKPSKEYYCHGAYLMLTNTISKYIEEQMRVWVEGSHRGIEENYYDNEIKKIEILKKELLDF